MDEPNTARCGKPIAIIVAVLAVWLLSGLAEGRKLQPSSEAAVRYGKTAAGFEYMMGPDDDPTGALAPQAAAYNLKLVISPRPGLADAAVLVLIGDNHSQSVERIMLRAPSLYIQLPPGVYTIAVRIQNKVVLIRDVNLRAGSQATYLVRGD